jgi:uncharacterized protein
VLREILATVGVACFASCMQRLSGFGFAILATPVLALAMPISRAVVVLSLVAFPSGVLNWRELGHHTDRRQVYRIVAWSCPGMLIGLLAHSRLPDRGFRIGLSIAVGVAAVVTATGWKVHARRATIADAVAGFISGILNTSVGTNGPPLVVSLSGQKMSPDAFRGTLAGVFTLSGVVAIVLFALDGLITRRALVLSAAGLPLVMAGRFIGAKVADRASDLTFHRVVVSLLFATSITGFVNAIR